MHVVAVSDPGQPRFVSLMPVRQEYGRSRRLAVADQRVYVADRRSGFSVDDASSPESLRMVAVSGAPGDGYDVRLLDGFAVVADRDYAAGDAEAGRLVVFDLSSLPPVGVVQSSLPLLTSGARGAAMHKRNK